MDFDALFNEKTFQFSDFQEFTVCLHGNGHLTPLQAQVNTLRKLMLSWRFAVQVDVGGCRQIGCVARKSARKVG